MQDLLIEALFEVGTTPHLNEGDSERQGSSGRAIKEYNIIF